MALQFTVCHVPRDKNSAADALSKRPFDADLCAARINNPATEEVVYHAAVIRTMQVERRLARCKTQTSSTESEHYTRKTRLWLKCSVDEPAEACGSRTRDSSCTRRGMRGNHDWCYLECDPCSERYCG